MNIRLLMLAATFIVLAATWARATDTPTAPSGKGGQGLTGAYYLPSSRGYHLDDEGLPVPTKRPDATRVDSQIAFGADKGFERGGGKGQLIWWVPERDLQVAAIWKGYVRLPKAGTYYFTTVSDDASAVYLNQSRVALNGGLGYYIESEAFRYPDLKPAPHPARPAYVVPVPVAEPRVLPMEVRYVGRNASSGHGFGIDLYWVTPDAKRDEAGRPIAELVPAAALFTEPPGVIEPAVVSRAHSTISSDFLYFPLDVAATLTVRLADERGRPVAGRRVHFSGLTSYGPPDLITQPQKPTDANGITTAKVQGNRVKHESLFFATDVTGFVDVGQTAEMTMAAREKVSFLLPAFSPYYDGKHFKVSPTPLRVGQPTTISVPLTNTQKIPAQLSVRLLTNPQNIGLRDWAKIGESETFVLKPEETRVVEIVWTPTRPSAHVCFKVEVWGTLQQRAGLEGGWPLVSRAHAASGPKEGAPTILDSRQQNIGRITSQTPNCQRYSGEITCDCDGDGQDETKETFESCGHPGWPTSFTSRCQDWVRDTTTYGYGTEITIQREGRAYLEGLEKGCPTLNCLRDYKVCEFKADQEFQRCEARKRLTYFPGAYLDCIGQEAAASEKCKQRQNTCRGRIGKASPQPLPTPTPTQRR